MIIYDLYMLLDTILGVFKSILNGSSSKKRKDGKNKDKLEAFHHATVSGKYLEIIDW